MRHPADARAHLVAVATLAVLGIVMARPATAAMTYDVLPAISIGVTDNALASPGDQVRDADVFGKAALMTRAQYSRPLSTHTAWLQVSRVQFYRDAAADASSVDSGLKSAIILTPGLDLALGVTAALSRTTGVTFINPEAPTPGATLAAPLTYFSTGASEELGWVPIPHHAYAEGLSVAQVRYLEDAVGLPTNTAVTGRLRGNWSFLRDTFSGEAILTDSYMPRPAPGALGPFAQGHVFLGQLLAGWRRELSLRWSTELQAGALAVFNLDGRSVIEPAGRAALEFRNVPWFATLILSQAPTTNLFLGQVTVNDQAVVRLALPLDPRQLMVVSGIGSYAYARIADSEGHLATGYSQVAAGASFAWRSVRLPLVAALEYTLSDQIGGTGAGAAIPSLVRQTLMLTLTGTFLFGPGTPPLLRPPG